MKQKWKLMVLLCATLFLAGCLEVHPTEAEEQHFDNGMAYFDQGRFNEAISEYTEALKTYPRWTTAYVNRAYAYISMGQYDNGIADCNKAIELDPNFAMAYYNRGLFYLNLGEYQLAIEDSSEAIRLNPEFA